MIVVDKWNYSVSVLIDIKIGDPCFTGQRPRLSSSPADSYLGEIEIQFRIVEKKYQIIGHSLPYVKRRAIFCLRTVHCVDFKSRGTFLI